MTSSTFLLSLQSGGSSEVYRKAQSALFYVSPSSSKHFPKKEKKVSKTPHYIVHTPSRESDTERDDDDDDAREMRAPALMMMGTPITDTADGGGGGGGQLPVAPLPDGLKDAPEETQQRYFKEAKRVAIEKCRTHRCGNDEVTAKTHLGPEIFTEDALLGRTEWKRPSLTACTAQEFAYDFFKFHENRGEFDYESLWECVFSLARRSSFCLWRRFRDASFYRSSFSRTTTTNGGFMWSP